MLPELDLVYVIGGGSRAKNAELRYSLRSVERFVTGYRRIHVIGQPPAWLQGVNAIPVPDPTDNKVLNQMHMWLTACNRAEISETFVEMHDDMIFLRPMDVRTIPYLKRGSIEARLKRRKNKHSRWDTALRNTLAALRSDCKLEQDAELHFPIRYHKPAFRAAVQPHYNAHNPILWRTLYTNVANVPTMPGTDPKIFGRASGEPKVLFSSSEWREWPLISLSSDLPKMTACREWLRDTFPDPCAFEAAEVTA